MRTVGSASVPAVANAKALASGRPAASASASQAPSCATGSGSRSAGSMGISREPGSRGRAPAPSVGPLGRASGRYRRPMPDTPAPERPEAVIFDLDGTLVDTVERRIEAWLQAFTEVGIPARRQAVSPLIGADGKALARRIAQQAGRRLSEEAVEEIDRRSGERFQALNVDPRPLPGAREL